MKKLSRRNFLRAAGGAAAGAALVACQPKTVIVKETVKETVVVEKEKTVKETVIVEKEKVVTAAPVEAAPVTITWMNWWGAYREQLMDEIIARFQEEQPHITVDNQVQPWDNAVQRRATAVASSDPPSLIMVPRIEAQKFAHEDLIIPIDAYIEAKGIDVYDVFYQGDMDTCKFAERFWSYPLPSAGVATSFWNYNKNMMRKAGLDPEAPPQTWQEVEQAVEATTVIKDGNIETLGLASLTGHSMFAGWTYCNNGKYYSDDAKELLFNQPEGVETLEWMQMLIEKQGGLDAYSAFLEGTDWQQVDWPFYNDKLCFGPVNVSVYGHMKAQVPEYWEDTERWGVMLVPYNSNNAQAQPTGLTGFTAAWNQVISKGLSQKVQDAAYEFLEFFTMRRAGGCWFLFEQARPAPVKACNENPDYYAANPYWDVILKALEIDRGVPVTPVQGEVAAFVGQAMEEVRFGLKTPKVALDWAYDQAQPIVDTFWSGT